MKKKILIGVLSIFVCFTLVGCGDKENTNNEGNNPLEQVPGNNTNQNNDPILDSYEIKSTDDRVVFTDPSGLNYNTFYFENNKIVKYEIAVNYGSVEFAQLAYQAAKDENPDVKVSIKGTYIILEEDADEYDDLTKTELEETLKLAGYKINN